jgi:hypothetical protein
MKQRVRNWSGPYVWRNRESEENPLSQNAQRAHLHFFAEFLRTSMIARRGSAIHSSGRAFAVQLPVSSQTWRRLHGEELSAHVLENGPRAYAVAVSRRSTRAAGVRQLPRVFAALEPAKAAADAFVRREFCHQCSRECCG